MVYSTVKPCFVKFLSCLSFKLGDLAKRSGECFVVASSRSYLAVGYLAGRLHLIVASCGRLWGKGGMWTDTHCSDSLQSSQGKSPWEAGQKTLVYVRGEACISYHKTITWMNLVNLDSSSQIKPGFLEGGWKINRIRPTGSCSNCNVTPFSYFRKIWLIHRKWPYCGVQWMSWCWSFPSFYKEFQKLFNCVEREGLPCMPYISDGTRKWAHFQS